MAIMGFEIGQALCDALQLPTSTTAFTMHVEANQIVSVTVTYYPDDGEKLVAALAEYDLVRRAETPADHVGFNFDAWMAGRVEAANAAMNARHARLSRLSIG